MAKEIERKYLVSSIPDNLEQYEKIDIIQGYISITPEIRIRMSNDVWYLTKKGDGTLERDEYEEEISIDEFNKYKGALATNMIIKTRYKIPLSNGLIAELDIYRGSFEGLATVEVEFPDVETSKTFIPPVFFGKDVTEDKRYKNKRLASLSTSEISNLIAESNDETSQRSGKRRQITNT